MLQGTTRGNGEGVMMEEGEKPEAGWEEKLRQDLTL